MQEEYHLLLDAIKDYAIYMLDPSGHVTTWNAGAERMKGYSEDEIIGQHFSKLFMPEDIEKNKPEKELQVALSKGRYEEEGWRRRKDGSRFWANIILTPIFSDTKEHIGFAKVTRDLTEKRRSEELYLLLVSQVREYAIFMMDTNGNILTWNAGAERIKGYTPYEIIGTNFSTFYSPEEQAAKKPQKELEIAIRTGKYEEEGWRIRKDGSSFWASIVITPIYTDRHIGFAKVTRDLTHRREMEKLTRANIILQTTNKELEQFAFTASHDLKAPLRKITTYTDIVLTEADKLAEKQQVYLKKVISSAKQMSTMIDDILNFSSLSAKEHFETYSLQKILLEILETLEHDIEEKKAAVHYTNLPDAIVIPSQMRQIFQNLLSNSLKFSKKDVPPVVHISSKYISEVHSENVWPADQYLQIVWQDNGIGFDPEDAEKIFNLFDRLNNRAAYEGSGLGLAICKKIAENHGGTITAKSEEGKGAEFTLIIPA